MTRHAHKMPEDEIIRLYMEEQLSENQLAMKYKVTRKVIALRLERAGVKRRDISETGRIQWTKMSFERRKEQTKRAREITRGKRITHEKQIKRAKGRQDKPKIYPLEKRFLEAFTRAGLRGIPQLAVDVFNIDCGFPEKRVAVEIDGPAHNSHPKTKAQDLRKEKFLREDGWIIIRFKEDDLPLCVEKLRSIFSGLPKWSEDNPK